MQIVLDLWRWILLEVSCLFLGCLKSMPLGWDGNLLCFSVIFPDISSLVLFLCVSLLPLSHPSPPLVPTPLLPLTPSLSSPCPHPSPPLVPIPILPLFLSLSLMHLLSLHLPYPPICLPPTFSLLLLSPPLLSPPPPTPPPPIARLPPSESILPNTLNRWTPWMNSHTLMR